MLNKRKIVILLMPGDSLINDVLEYRVCRGDFMVRFAETDINNPMLTACRKSLPKSATLKLLYYPSEEGRVGHIAMFSVPSNDIGSIKPIEVTVYEM